MNAHRQADHGYGCVTTETRGTLAPSPAADIPPHALTSDERWTRWQEKGARLDARIVGNMARVIAVVALAAGAIWASASLII